MRPGHSALRGIRNTLRRHECHVLVGACPAGDTTLGGQLVDVQGPRNVLHTLASSTRSSVGNGSDTTIMRWDDAITASTAINRNAAPRSSANDHA